MYRKQKGKCRIHKYIYTRTHISVLGNIYPPTSPISSLPYLFLPIFICIIFFVLSFNISLYFTHFFLFLLTPPVIFFLLRLSLLLSTGDSMVVQVEHMVSHNVNCHNVYSQQHGDAVKQSSWITGVIFYWGWCFKIKLADSSFTVANTRTQ